MVEFAILLPVLAFLMVIAIDFGRVFFSYIQVTNAAREAAAYGQVLPADLAGIRTRAGVEKNVQGQGGENALTVTTECRTPAGTIIDCVDAPGGTGAGNTLTVMVEEPFDFLTPLINGFFNDSFTMRTSATSTVLGYAGSSTGGPPTGTCSGPLADFSIIVTSGTSIEVDPAASTPNAPGNPCNISGYIWTWGDGNDNIGNASAAQHTYTAPGTYTVKLEVTNQGGSSTKSSIITVPKAAVPTCTAPHAAYTFTKSGSGGKTHTYVDTSTVADPVNCPITQWLWTFPDGTQSNASAPAPQTYGSNSKHTVTLQVTNAGGSNTFSWNH